MRDGDGQTAGGGGVGEACVDAELPSEVMSGVDRDLVERARAGTTETDAGCGRAG